jgi:hypothetical protein
MKSFKKTGLMEIIATDRTLQVMDSITKSRNRTKDQGIRKSLLKAS